MALNANQISKEAPKKPFIKVVASHFQKPVVVFHRSFFPSTPLFWLNNEIYIAFPLIGFNHFGKVLRDNSE